MILDLKSIVQEENYFLLTTNGEGHFQKTGFDGDRLCEIEGNWLELQCATPYCDTLTDSLPVAQAIIGAETKGADFSHLIPKCAHCGGDMQIHMLGDDRFVPIHGAINRLNRFLSNAQNHPSLVVELGVGARNGFVKHPIMQWVARTPQAFYVSVNLGELFIPADIAPRSLGINASISQFLVELKTLI